MITKDKIQRFVRRHETDLKIAAFLAAQFIVIGIVAKRLADVEKDTIAIPGMPDNIQIEGNGLGTPPDYLVINGVEYFNVNK